VRIGVLDDDWDVAFAKGSATVAAPAAAATAAPAATGTATHHAHMHKTAHHHQQVHARDWLFGNRNHSA
jgi:hypothetical protein